MGNQRTIVRDFYQKKVAIVSKKFRWLLGSLD